MCIGLCSCKRCMTSRVLARSLAQQGLQQQAELARHTLHWIAPELRRLHAAKASEVGAVQDLTCWQALACRLCHH